jgi:hypothetical protein
MERITLPKEKDLTQSPQKREVAKKNLKGFARSGQANNPLNHHKNPLRLCVFASLRLCVFA